MGTKSNLTVSIDSEVLEEARETLKDISHKVEMLLRKEIVKVKKQRRK